MVKAGSLHESYKYGYFSWNCMNIFSSCSSFCSSTASCCVISVYFAVQSAVALLCLWHRIHSSSLSRLCSGPWSPLDRRHFFMATVMFSVTCAWICYNACITGHHLLKKNISGSTVMNLLISGNFLWVDWTGVPHKVRCTVKPCEHCHSIHSSVINKEGSVSLTPMLVYVINGVACGWNVWELMSKLTKL